LGRRTIIDYLKERETYGPIGQELDHATGWGPSNACPYQTQIAHSNHRIDGISLEISTGASQDHIVPEAGAKTSREDAKAQRRISNRKPAKEGLPNSASPSFCVLASLADEALAKSALREIIPVFRSPQRRWNEFSK